MLGLDDLVRPEVLVPGLVYATMRAVQRSRALSHHPRYVQTQAVLPMVLGGVFIWIPGLAVEQSGPLRTAIGVLLGAFAGQVVKAWRQGVLRRDERLHRPGGIDIG